jgi:hypothetical protein
MSSIIRPNRLLPALLCAFSLVPLVLHASPNVPAAPPLPTLGAPNAIVELDLNSDGQVDYRVVYDAKGNLAREELDFNYDGVMDTFYYYANGVLARQEIDTKSIGRIDLWIYLVDGLYVQRYERDTDGDGKPDVVRNFGGG